MEWISVGIDPGATGGFAYVGSDGSVGAWTLDTKCLRDLIDCINELPKHNKLAAALEYVWGRGGGWSAHTNFQLGGAYHVAKQALEIKQIPFAEIRPKDWQAHVWDSWEHPHTSAERKATLVLAAEAHYPHLKLKSGEADAILLARYQANRVFGAPL